MYRKEVNERSPMRVFERSIHGGLGRGNVGVVMSRAGVGKTAFLVDIALDDLMRERKVLHINIDDPVEKVRAFYDEIFADLAVSMKLENRDKVHLTVERNRLIQTFSADSFALEKVKKGIALAHEHMNFQPEVIILDGYPRFSLATEEDILQIKDLAKRYDCEVWVSARATRRRRGRARRAAEDRALRGVPVGAGGAASRARSRALAADQGPRQRPGGGVVPRARPENAVGQVVVTQAHGQ